MKRKEANVLRKFEEKIEKTKPGGMEAAGQGKCGTNKKSVSKNM